MYMAVFNRNSPDVEAIVTYLADQGASLNTRDENNIGPADFVNRVGPESLRVFYIQLMKDRGVPMSKNH